MPLFPAACRHRLLLLGCCLLMVAGCGRDLPDTAPVRGVVEYDGAPLTDFQHGAVIFTPNGGRMAKGVIDPSDGSFTLSTFQNGDGAIVGPARVTVTATVDDPQEGGGSKHPGVRFVIPENFADRDLSGLTCEVMPGDENVFRIRISSDGSGQIEAE